MSEDQTLNGESENEDAILTEADELSLLKQRARMMGVQFSNNIGLESLKERIRAKQEGESESNEQKSEVAPLSDPAKSAPVAGKRKTLRQHLIEENMKLVRLRITNLDPKKKDLPGEVFTVANEHLGTVRKFVPYGEVTDNGYHVPYCIYKALKARKFLNIRTFKDRQNQNQIKVEQSWAQELALEVLPTLTPDEIKKLAAAQSAAGGLN